MIRLPPSTILLGRRDLRDYEKRQRTRGREKRQETDKISQRLSCFAVGSSHNDPHLGQAHKDQLSKAASQKADVRPACVLPPASQDTSLIDNDKSLPSSLDEEISVTESQEDEHGYITVGLDQSPENPIHDTPRPASPSKDDFYYGGFVETPSLGVIGDPHSPFSMINPKLSECILLMFAQPQTTHPPHSNYNFPVQTGFVAGHNYLAHLFFYPKTLLVLPSVVQLLV